MKRCKTLLCLALALIMALSLCTVAMAEEPTTEPTVTVTLEGYYYGGYESGATVQVNRVGGSAPIIENTGYAASVLYKTPEGTNAVNGWFGAQDYDMNSAGNYILKISFLLGTEEIPATKEGYTLSLLKYSGAGEVAKENGIPVYETIEASNCAETNGVTVVIFDLPLDKINDSEVVTIAKNVEKKGNVAPGETTFGLDIYCNHSAKDEGSYPNYYNLIKIDDSFTYTPGTSEYAIKVSGPKAVLDDFMVAQGFFVREKTHADAAWACDTTMWYVRDHSWGVDGQARLTCTKADTWGVVPTCPNDEHCDHDTKLTFTNIYTKNTVTPKPSKPAPTVVEAPKTFDGGVVLCAALSVLSMTGAVVVGKKRDK